MSIDNIEKSDVTLFWQSTAQWQTLTETWEYYTPYIFTRIDNIEKT